MNNVCSRCGHKNGCKHAKAYLTYYYEDWDSVEVVSSGAATHTYTGGAGYTYMSCPDCGRNWNNQYAEELIWTEPHRFRRYVELDDEGAIVFVPQDDVYHACSGPGVTYDRCTVCGETQNEVRSDTTILKATHTYDEDGVCTVCGHRRTVLNGLAITEEPKGVRTHTGQKATFTVKATGKKVSYQWYSLKKGTDQWTKIKDATKSTLTVTAKPEYDGYQYRCQVKNASGSLTSMPALLTVIYYPPVITEEPEDKAVNSGEKATFTVKATGAETYQWYSLASAKGKWTKIKGATQATLTVSAKSSNNGYRYRCEVGNGDGTVLSAQVRLTVFPRPPIITQQPESRTEDSGTNVSFTVKATGAESCQWSYRKSASGKWSKIKNATKATLTVTARGSNNGYQYRCELKNGEGAVFTIPATLTVNVYYPEITRQPEDATADVGEEVTFTVEAEHADSIQWSYRKSAKGKWTTMKGETRATLTVTATSAKNGYQYRCVVKNADGTATSNAAKLSVTKVPPEITLQPESADVAAGEQVTFRVEADHATGYQWYYRKKAKGSWKKVKGATKAAYTITATSAKNGYQYRVLVKNSDGSVKSDIATLKVN